eukprot:CAMPEP_0204156354 /NCGR_PEP_ID=MMETSP0361-20130328/30365_1 /ASSEMBLY_ACC=CAM_ASM_000343 /TAXON_ID=268821 /ORGANISM="Scrippsiella Hangoei, Strain SHTV-5" /LENGTH=64 /DNA_ID=CAMNT_0051111973 /DNA_START=26 /DNA_END=217 /DNA_ORIENTATION=-
MAACGMSGVFLSRTEQLAAVYPKVEASKAAPPRRRSSRSPKPAGAGQQQLKRQTPSVGVMPCQR